MDSVISKMESRFMSINQYFKNFDFLYDLNKLKKSKIPNTETLSGFTDSSASGWEQWLPTLWVVWGVKKYDPKFT